MGDSTSIHGAWGAWFDVAPLAVLVHRDRQVRYVNGAAARLLGADAAELLGKPVPPAARGAELAAWNCPEGAVVVFGGGHDREDRFRRLFEEAPIAYHEIDAHGTIV